VVHYIKPLQCGGSDADFVRKYAEKLVDSSGGAAAATLSLLKTSTLYRWETPASPHTASMLEDKPCSDEQVLDSLRSELQNVHAADVTYVETAGGVLSPSSASPLNQRRGPLSHAYETDQSSGVEWGWSTQGDLYQDLIGVAPVVLVGDGRLGGISCTLSALESLVLRGYDVAALILLRNRDDTHQNMNAIQSYLRSKRIRSGSGEILFSRPRQSLLTLPPVPADPRVPLDEWFESAEVTDTFCALDMFLDQSWQGEVDDRKATVGPKSTKSSSLWHRDGDCTVESAKGNWTSVRTAAVASRLYDVSSSRWEHGDVVLGLAMAAALGRYGNHSTATCTTAPKEALAQLFRHRKLIFVDMEAAIRMGIRTYQQRMKVSAQELQSIDWIVAGQEDCYHGHSLASLCIAEEYFDRDHPWYQSKSFLLAPPTFGYQAGQLRLEFPAGMDISPDVSREFNSIDQVIDVRARTMTKLFSLYKEMIEMQWLVHEHSSHRRKIASVVLEPLLLTSGMTIKWVDPLWQRAMVAVAESRSIPIVFDESMTGLYRLGYQSMTELLGVSADVSVFSNRSSLFPTNTNFCVASHEVYKFCQDDSFLAESSYEVSPAECNAALHILSALKQYWSPSSSSSSSSAAKRRVKGQLFTDQHASDLSRLDGVRSATVLDTILTVTFQGPNNNDNGDDEELANLIAATIKSEGGLVLQQCGASLLAEVGPWTSSAVCDSIVHHLHRSIQAHGKKS
jgi:bifunctional dethiobiotin synthetase / adenosylmethionine---8-amino-7-oxononanoate aminotransferase